MYVDLEKFFLSKRRIGKCLLAGEGKRSKIWYMFPEETEKISTDFPEVDIQNMHYEDNSFDYVVADQVLEHVRKPWVAVEEIRRVLKPGGYAILTSCLIMHKHAVPSDYWRFTEDGLEVLCENYSSIKTTGSNGSLKLVNMCQEGYRSKAVAPGSKLEKIALTNDNLYPLTVWIIARK